MSRPSSRDTVKCRAHLGGNTPTQLGIALSIHNSKPMSHISPRNSACYSLPAFGAQLLRLCACIDTPGYTHWCPQHPRDMLRILCQRSCLLPPDFRVQVTQMLVFDGQPGIEGECENMWSLPRLNHSSIDLTGNARGSQASPQRSPLGLGNIATTRCNVGSRC